MTESIMQIINYDTLDGLYGELLCTEYNIAWRYWAIGLELETQLGSGPLSESVAMQIADRYNRRDHKEIYRWRSFARICPTREAVEAAAEDKLGGKDRLSWDGVRKNLLPTRTKDPEQSGGKAPQTDAILGVSEWSITQIEELLDARGADMPLDELRTITGALEGIKGHAEDMLGRLGVSEPVDGRPTLGLRLRAFDEPESYPGMINVEKLPHITEVKSDLRTQQVDMCRVAYRLGRHEAARWLEEILLGGEK